MIAPALLLLIVFTIVPMVLGFALAFTNARLVSPYSPSFTGLTNFIRLFEDPRFLRALVNVLYFAVVVVPVQSGFALLLAVLINGKIRGATFYRTIYFMPVVTSMVVVSLLWMFMYQENGLINEILAKISFGYIQGPDWLNTTTTAMPAIILMSVWQGVGFHMVIWLSGLQTIPGELYEAASLDGAGRWQKFAYVTWPGLRSTRTVILVYITIQALGLFTQINVMTQGGPRMATTTVVFEAVRSGFQQQETAYACAISTIFFVIVLVINAVQRYFMRDRG